MAAPRSGALQDLGTGQRAADRDLHVHSAFANLDEWARKGTPAPRGARLDIVGEGQQVRIAKDRFGNALGGVRTPWVDVPAATYHAGHGPGPGCGQNFGYTEPFHWARLDALYGSCKSYLSRMSQAVDRAVKDRCLTDVGRPENQGGPGRAIDRHPAGREPLTRAQNRFDRDRTRGYRQARFRGGAGAPAAGQNP